MNYPYPSDMGQKIITNYDIEIISSLSAECLLFSFIDNDDSRDHLKEKLSGIQFAEPLMINMHAKYHLGDAVKTLLKSLLYLIPFNCMLSTWQSTAANYETEDNKRIKLTSPRTD